MNASIESQAGERPIDQWFAHYSGDHRNAMNQRIHVVAVPLILWSVIGLLWPMNCAIHATTNTPSASLNSPGVPRVSCSQRVSQAIATNTASMPKPIAREAR